MLPNPYTPGELPRVFAGREEQQDHIRTALARTAAYGEMGGPLLVFQGPRGVGKTSLLRDAQRDAREHGFVSAWVSCRRGSAFLPDLADRVAHAVDEAGVIDRRDQGRWAMRLDKIGVELGIPSGIKVTAEGTPARRESHRRQGGARISALEDLLHDTSTRIRAHGGAGLVLFIDELHAPTRDDTAVLLNALQNLAGNREDNPLTVVSAGLPSTPAALTKAATFGERSTFVTLPRLDDTAAAAAVRLPADELGVGWTPDALGSIVAQAQGFPYVVQVLAHATWRTARPEAGDVLDVAAVRAGIPSAEDQLTTMYAARWGAASDLEKSMMTAMAEAGTTTVARSSIATALGRSSQALSVPRDRLVDKGIIEPAGHGELRFTLPGFDAYVRGIGTDRAAKDSLGGHDPATRPDPPRRRLPPPPPMGRGPGDGPRR